MNEGSVAQRHKVTQSNTDHGGGQDASEGRLLPA